MNLKIDFAACSDKGKSRLNNEDSVLVDNALPLAIVADGMGGHNSGEVASKIAVDVTREKFSDMLDTQVKPAEFDEEHSLQANQLAFAAKLANSVVFEAAGSAKKDKGMGTTLTAAFQKNDKIVIVHIGDSRAYFLRKKEIRQITEDHSLVMDHVRKGVMTREQAEKSPLQNILTKALGTQKNPTLDMYEISITQGDKIILCTDGLFKAISEKEMLNVILDEKNDETACKKLIEIANINGGPDNVTVAIGTVLRKTFKEIFKETFLKK